MQNLISNTLGSSSFVILNKAVIKALGMHEAKDALIKFEGAWYVE